VSEIVRIIGIDPGSVKTGWGVVDSDGRANQHVAHGTIATGGGSLPERLGVIQREVTAVIAEHEPGEMGVEEVFVARNAMAALKLGQARGAAICAGVARELPVAEYSARLVKQSLVGGGGSGKGQVQYMVLSLLGLAGPLGDDAADALGIALCHAHARTRPAAMVGVTRRRKSRRWP
jgi:crossover junction endodeoxyribonuclease RuvC